MDTGLATTIEAFLTDRGFPLGKDEPGLRKLSGGNSHVTWHGTFGGHGLVIKVAQSDGPLAPYDVGHEARMMELAWRGGVPVPEVIGHYRQGEDQFIVMRHVDGDAPSLWEVAKWLETVDRAERLAIARNFLSLLPALRSVDPHGSEALEDHYRAYVDRLVGDLEAAARAVIALPSSFEKVGDWLNEHASLCADAELVLHHGDYRLGNVVFADRSVVALLDWERAMPGHPLHDLGFLCLPGMKIGDRIGGLLSQAELQRLWPEIAGEDLDLRTVAYFRIMSMFSELCYMTRAMCRLADGKARLSGARALPLIARLHHDLLSSIIAWQADDFTL